MINHLAKLSHFLKQENDSQRVKQVNALIKHCSAQPNWQTTQHVINKWRPKLIKDIDAYTKHIRPEDLKLHEHDIRETMEYDLLDAEKLSEEEIKLFLNKPILELVKLVLFNDLDMNFVIAASEIGEIFNRVDFLENIIERMWDEYGSFYTLEPLLQDFENAMETAKKEKNRSKNNAPIEEFLYYPYDFLFHNNEFVEYYFDWITKTKYFEVLDWRPTEDIPEDYYGF